ncbi:hypothetical protein HII12_000221 [Brettanomyces bruxellensis]|uniref:Molybdopterin synthase sulfur carrier subunit n=1 Tax=Dekkera bruxellensis TaxID=5007 RepID=A0A8H6EZI1_DEKBR|nr:hypothetical protein HII12_000221 [Brettanomyces bruxellensis]
MIIISIEYFGPAKRFTNGRSNDDLKFVTSSQIISLQQVLCKLGELYGDAFFQFIIETCGIALNEEYLNVNREIELCDVGKEISLHNNDGIVIVPPVSSG